jgi:hypothetical protein
LAGFHFVSPQIKEEMSQVVDHLIKNYKAEDKVYIYGPA